MRLPSEIVVENCDPNRDLPGVIDNLQANGMYIDGQDDEATLRGFLEVIPDSVIVAKGVGHNMILGNAYLPFSQIPIIGRLAVNPNVVFSEDMLEVRRHLYNHCFDVLRDRHPRMPHVEELYDWPDPRPAPPPHEPYAKFGFTYTWDLLSAKRPLRDEHGNPTPNIPPRI